MKKTLFFVVAVIFMAIRSLATVHTVTVQDFSFSPATMTIPLGDSVRWVWVNGTHTTSSTSVPTGGVAWDQNMTSSSTTFTYKPAVAGTYNYRCNVHPTMMTGTITVTSNAAVPAAVANTGVAVYPNPVASDLHLQFRDAAPTTVEMVNVLGGTVFTAQLNINETLLNVNDLPAGTYYMNITHGDLVYKHELLIAH